MLKSLLALLIALTMVACQPEQDNQTAPQAANSEVLEYTQSNDESCVCVEIYAPVCGVDGETYSNACHAQCKNVEIASDGACEAKAMDR